MENFSFDYNTVYVGVMSPEENMIVILQNVLMFIYSSIGYVMLLPFYQVRNRRRWECDRPLGDFLCFQRTTPPARTDDTGSELSLSSSGLGVSDQSLSYASWLLRYMAENLEYYVSSAEYPDTDMNYVSYPEYPDLDYDFTYVNNTISLV